MPAGLAATSGRKRKRRRSRCRPKVQIFQPAIDAGDAVAVQNRIPASGRKKIGLSSAASARTRSGVRRRVSAGRGPAARRQRRWRLRLRPGWAGRDAGSGSRPARRRPARAPTGKRYWPGPPAGCSHTFNADAVNPAQAGKQNHGEYVGAGFHACPGGQRRAQRENDGDRSLLGPFASGTRALRRSTP